ncbi:MAG: nucleoside hydrolase [Acidobacteriota bacterium]
MMKYQKPRLLFLLFTAIICSAVFHNHYVSVAHEDADHHADDLLKVMVDTDMGLDDVRALFTLFGDSRVDIKAIVTVEGSASIGKGLDNAIGAIEASHKDSIPVFRGVAFKSGEIPRWRETVDRLAGFPFPPPRRVAPQESSFQGIVSLVQNHDGEIHYLALGPLSNLARLEAEKPGILARLHTIWIPASVTDNGQIESWNLAYDRGSTRTVFDRAPRIILLDVSAAKTIDPCTSFSSIDASSFPASWIERLFRNLCAKGKHCIMYDELLAASLIGTKISIVSDTAHRAFVSDVIRIEPDIQGNIYMASIQDLDGAVDLLKDLWSRPFQREPMHTHTAELISTEDLLKRFHGHLGPYVVLGYRMGQLALELTGSDGHFNITADVHSILKPPQSCLIDGVQLGSGCTLGKRNIEVHETDGPAFAIFTVKGGSKVTIRIRNAIPSIVTGLINEDGVEAAGQTFLEKDSSELFEIQTSYPAETDAEMEKK